MQKVREVHDALHVWDRRTLQAPVKRMKELKRDLEKLRRGPMNDTSLVAQKELLVRIELLLEQEEMIWVQRAQANWLKHPVSNRRTNR